MIGNSGDFELETAWERTILAEVAPVMSVTTAEVDLDMRTKTVYVAVADFAGQGNVDKFKELLMPLMFGAAWKVVDLALELALSSSNPSHSTSGVHSDAEAGVVPKSGG